MGSGTGTARERVFVAVCDVLEVVAQELQHLAFETARAVREARSYILDEMDVEEGDK